MPYDPQKYGPVFESLLSVKSIPPLGIGNPDIFRQSQIVGNTLEALFLRNEIKNFDMARCCHAGIMIFNSFLDPAKQLLSHISSDTSNYWQGILARREMKPGEATKFFSSFANHPVYIQMDKLSKQLAAKHTNCYITKSPVWEAGKFANYCKEQAGTGSAEEKLCQTIQLAEMRLLFDFSYESAVNG